MVDGTDERTRCWWATTSGADPLFLAYHDEEWGRASRDPVDYLWSFVGGRPIRNRWPSLGGLPDQTPESAAMSRDLKRRGFRFVGPTVCYSFMQATGMVNDHLVDCFRWVDLDAAAARLEAVGGESSR